MVSSCSAKGTVGKSGIACAAVPGSAAQVKAPIGTLPRPLSAIAIDIREDWKKPYFGALPYIVALAEMSRVTDNYGVDPGADIVARFLSNASTWRGETARRVKAELSAMIKAK